MKKEICSRFVTDHLGNRFPTIKSMCESYGIKQTTYLSRIKHGWSQEKALTMDVKACNREPVSDHLGNSFPTFTSLCQHYGIDTKTLRDRLKRMSLSDALTLPVNSPSTSIIYKCEDHNGREYASVTAMCKAYCIKLNTYRGRIRDGWTMERSLTQSPIDYSKCVTDHYGNHFSSTQSMCKEYGIDRRTFTVRVKELGWSVEKALTTPPRKRSPKKKHIGTT